MISIPATVLAVLLGVLMVALMYSHCWYTRRGYWAENILTHGIGIAMCRTDFQELL